MYIIKVLNTANSIQYMQGLCQFRPAKADHALFFLALTAMAA